MNKKALFILTWITILIPNLILSYEIKTHELISVESLKQSIFGVPEQSPLSDLGISGITTLFPNSKGEAHNILQLIIDGSSFEDDGTNFTERLIKLRVLNHFYDPFNNQSLGINIRGIDILLGCIPISIFGVDVTIGCDSPSWALEDTASIPFQNFSFRDARNYLYNALTRENLVERNANFGLTFQAIGHVIHHLQDMAQPQHVRNDFHCDALLCLFMENEFGVSNIYHPSTYEKFTQARQHLPLISGNGAHLPVYSAQDSTTFDVPRKFWHDNAPIVGNRKGIANYTNREFVSIRTNFTGKFAPNGRDVVVNNHPRFPFPNGGRPNEGSIISLCQTSGGALPCLEKAQITDPEFNAPGLPPIPKSLTGEIWFIKNKPIDYRGIAEELRVSTFSLFDNDLSRYVGGDWVFSLNRFNYLSAHQLLIPRAVGYSAGLINYFFRGKLNFVPDPQIPGQGRIQNLGPEPMQGIFTLYYDGVDGKRHEVLTAIGADGELLQDGTRVLPVSNPNNVHDGLLVTVTPPNQPRPSMPGEYMLVFHGDMGEEKSSGGAIGAVVGKQVSIPLPRCKFIFWVSGRSAFNRGSINRVNSDCSNSLIIPNIDGPLDITLDVTRRKIYWTGRNPLQANSSFSPAAVLRANFDGSNIEPIATDPDTNFFDIYGGLALGGNQVYWTVRNGRNISRANLIPNASIERVIQIDRRGGSNISDVTYAMALNLSMQVAYVTTLSDDIVKADLQNPLESNAVTTLIQDEAFPELDGGLKFNPNDNRIYWVQGNSIKRIDINGFGIGETFPTGGSIHGIALDLVDGKIYWTSGNKIRRANLDFLNMEDVTVLPSFGAGSLAVLP